MEEEKDSRETPLSGPEQQLAPNGNAPPKKAGPWPQAVGRVVSSKNSA